MQLKDGELSTYRVTLQAWQTGHSFRASRTHDQAATKGIIMNLILQSLFAIDVLRLPTNTWTDMN